ncbi:hypothetical protein [Marinifilum flexuosum]|uniref:Uncharacterized protein n=1 Tax=Marinifilum flexuosum TaxID=1117708 RepID=A0A419WMV4_9BACT|nr:hypothetical protein [Marinifilum flexuosum]RKD96791.1 hypothetical protein BXY64_3738 [Marinifilum flexuosum]
MSLIGDFINSAGGGVLTGLIGNFLTTFANIKMQKLKNQHEIAMVQANTEAMKAETEANIQITETQVQGELAKSDNEIYHEAIKQEGKRNISNEIIAKLFDSPWTTWLGCILVFLLGIVDFLKTAIRPGLTIYFVILTSWLTWIAYNIIVDAGEVMTAEEAVSIFKNQVNQIVYLTVTCVIWWFADRRNAKFQYRLNDGNLRK